MSCLKIFVSEKSTLHLGSFLCMLVHLSTYIVLGPKSIPIGCGFKSRLHVLVLLSAAAWTLARLERIMRVQAVRMLLARIIF